MMVNILEKRKKMAKTRKELIRFFENNWSRGHDPSLKEVVDGVEIDDVDVLKKALRRLRTRKVLHGYHDKNRQYRFCKYGKVASHANDIFMDERVLGHVALNQ